VSAFTGRHIMVDLETFSLGKDATFTQIGAVAFYPERGEVSLTERFNRFVDIGSSLGMGRSFDPGTMLWWMQQSDDARWALINGQKIAVPVPEALLDFAKFCSEGPGKRGMGNRPVEPDGVWSHGSVFDIAILEDAYARCGLRRPWHYVKAYDTRTIFAMSDPLVGTGRGTDKWEPDRNAHEALSDAVEQAYDLLMGLHALDRGPDVVRYGDPAPGMPKL